MYLFIHSNIFILGKNIIGYVNFMGVLTSRFTHIWFQFIYLFSQTYLYWVETLLAIGYFAYVSCFIVSLSGLRVNPLTSFYHRY